MKDEIVRLVKLCERYREYSLKVNGWETNIYNGVYCYFALERDHTSVDLEGSNGISFFNPPHVKLILPYLLNLTKLSDLIDKKSKELDKLESEFTEETTQKIETKRLQEIELLEKRVADLKENKMPELKSAIK